MPSLEWYLSSSLNWQKKGIEFESRGDSHNAAECYFKSAEDMLKAASLSLSEVKKTRLETSKKLIEKGQSLKSMAGNPILDVNNQTPREKTPVSHRRKDDHDDETSDEFLSRIGVLNIEVPNVTFDDVAGLDALKNDIRSNIILPFLDPEAARIAREFDHRPGGGKLLYGPPGTGKTFIVKAIANEVNAFFIRINPSDLLSQWFGELEKNISKLFRVAREHAPCVLFFDEIDALAPKRGSTSSTVMKRAVPALLSEMDGISDGEDKALLIIGATNEPWSIDEALLRPGRLGEKIYIPPPDLLARSKIFELYLKKARTADINFEELASRTDGFSAADIKFICTKTKSTVYDEVIKTRAERSIITEDLIRTIGETKPSISPERIKEYENFAKYNVKDLD